MRSELLPDRGIPASTLLMMSAVAGITVANLYYNQPLLEEIRSSLDCSETMSNMITVVTQAGYALGLLLIVPMADMWSRRRIVTVIMGIAAAMAACIALSSGIWTVLAASLLLGACSVIPQIFIPVAGQFSRPEHKSRNMGYVLSGLLTGILGARVISGYVGQLAGWRTMFAAAAVLMIACLLVTLRMLPRMPNTFKGSYRALIASVWEIFTSHPRMRLYALRGACTFGSMMSIWACMAFHLAGEPFHAGSRTVGMLGLCGVAGAVAASGIGRYVPRLGIRKMSAIGAVLQLLAWTSAATLGHTYTGIVAAIILLELGAQFTQLSNQSGCLAAVPDASNRANTVFMTSLFLGGSLATLVAGAGWRLAGWHGVCLTGAVFSAVALGTTIRKN